MGTLKDCVKIVIPVPILDPFFFPPKDISGWMICGPQMTEGDERFFRFSCLCCRLRCCCCVFRGAAADLCALLRTGLAAAAAGA